MNVNENRAFIYMAGPLSGGRGRLDGSHHVVMAQGDFWCLTYTLLGIGIRYRY